MKVCLIYVLLIVITISESNAIDCPNCSDDESKLVCATNGVIFQQFVNLCQMVRLNCLTGSTFKKTNQRNCIKNSVISTNCNRIRCTTDLNPVCGKCRNNFKKFQNNCQMILHNCVHDTNYTVTNINECSQSCNQYCALIYSPVCGKNGNDYLIFSNECFLTIYNCINNKNYKVININDCNQSCNQFCPDVYNPVCGKNGNEYLIFSNECFLTNYNCVNNKKFVVFANGLCPTTCPNCELLAVNTVCGSLVGGITINFKNTCALLCARATTVAASLCCTQENCPNSGVSVCATDGTNITSFTNLCRFNNFNCANNFGFQLVVGRCQPDCARRCLNERQNEVCGFDGNTDKYILFRNPCALACTSGILQVDLSFCGLTCRLTECPDPRVGAAVCATDGSIFVSFPSLCHLNNFNCRSGNKVFNETGLETCPINGCPNCVNIRKAPVCGFDGTTFITFDNICLLNCAAGFRLAISTACAFKCAQTDCRNVIDAPFCATDGTTFRQFSNTCEMKNFNCAAGTAFNVTTMRICPAQTCLSGCLGVPKNPVCGSDGVNTVTFDNICLLNCATSEFDQVSAKLCGLNCPTRNCENSTLPAICATDGNTVRSFANLCYMNQFNCLNTKEFTVTQLSKCNCLVQDCTQVPNVTICGIDSTGNLQTFLNVCDMNTTNCLSSKDFTQIDLINCVRNCTTQNCTGNNGTQVCGSDSGEHRTFGNECRMNNYNCRFHTNFEAVSMSVCDPNNCTVPTNCSTDGPVCGFNGTIHELFLNECRMLRSNCRNGDDFLRSNMTNCIPPTSSNCTVNPNCPNGNGSICATNGEQFRNFTNICRMQNFNCRNNETFDITRSSLCDPSDPCIFNCSVNPNNLNICGRDGRRVKEFNSICEMDKENCRRNTNFKKVDNAECNNQTCTQTHCSQRKDLVCATNGIHNEIFDNICTLNNYNCRNNANFTITSKDNCGCQRVCPTLYAPVCAKCRNEKPQIISNQCFFNIHSCENDGCKIVDMKLCENDPSTCKMISCTNVHNPICAFNGKDFKTFNNLCLMDNYNCLNKDNYKKCDPKECKICTEYKCSNVNNPVCAKWSNDVREFENRCKLDNYNCRNNADYQVVDSSNCKNCKILKCSSVYNPICATNGKIFKQFTNRCLLDNYNCKNDEDYNECDSSKCESNDECKILKCTNTNNPICATNGKMFKTFNNRCLLDNYNCKSKEEYVETASSNCKKCTLHQCLNVNNPICATDGKQFKTFSNRCFLDNFNCEYGCDFVECDAQKCKDNNDLRGVSECKTYKCTNVENQICATDGNKYKMFLNRCFLNNYNCENDLDYDECDIENCKKCTVHKCTDVYNPICGTSGKHFKMFNNRCHLENYNCENNDYTYLPTNKEFCKTTPDVCLSTATCIGIYYPVCTKSKMTGENVYYTNPCNVAVDNCLNKGDANIVSYENCDDVATTLPMHKKCEPCPNYFPYSDICAKNNVTYAIFSSECNLKYYNCRFDENFKITDKKHCKTLSLNYENPEEDIDMDAVLAPVVD